LVGTVQNNGGTTRRGGVTGRGFTPGRSGNPSGRPKGLARRVREIVGEDGEAIIQFMLDVMLDTTARRADRIEAAKWLGDRGFGRSIQGLEIDVATGPGIDLKVISTEDLDALIAILEKYDPDAEEAVQSGVMPIDVGPPALPTGSRRR
jgi:hypothetical protein